MTNAEKFKMYFGLYATEVWAKSETEFLKWLNTDVQIDSCDDAVSREMIMRHYDSGEYKHVNHISRNGLLDYIEQLPSVTPKWNDLDSFGNPLKLSLNIKGITCEVLAKDLRKAINNAVEKAEKTDITAFVVSKEL